MHCIHPCRLREYPTSGCMGAMGAKGNIISEPNAGSVLDGIVWCIRLKKQFQQKSALHHVQIGIASWSARCFLKTASDIQKTWLYGLYMFPPGRECLFRLPTVKCLSGCTSFLCSQRCATTCNLGIKAQLTCGTRMFPQRHQPRSSKEHKFLTDP